MLLKLFFLSFKYPPFFSCKQAILDAINSGHLLASVEVVISNKSGSYILERARQHGVEAVFIGAKDKKREDYDDEVAKELEKQ